MQVQQGHILVRVRATGQVLQMARPQALALLRLAPAGPIEAVKESAETSMLNRSSNTATGPAHGAKGRKAGSRG